MTALIIISGYLALLLALGLFSSRFFKGTAADFFLASRGIGSFLLLMSLFGTTMTAFALVGSSGEAFQGGIGVYGKMASSSGIVHSACFFLVGIKLWSLGKRHGYTTQIQYFRDRFESNNIGIILFPILVGLIIPYLLVGVIGAGRVMSTMTKGAFPAAFKETAGGLPPWLGAGVICLVVMIYVFFGGVRGTAWANAFQTIVFIVLGAVTFIIIANKIGGFDHATEMVKERNPSKLQRSVAPADEARYEEKLAAYEANPDKENAKPPKKPHGITQLEFFTYFFIPLSVGMFPHLFQHWLTAKSAKSFRLSVIAHPLLIMIVWVPCVLIGVWATSAYVGGKPVLPPGFSNPNAVLAFMVNKLSGDVLGGFLAAGILAAIMSSLDSQFLCIGSIFTNDIVNHYMGHDRLSDRSRVVFGRIFVVLIVVVTYVLAVELMQLGNVGVFSLGIWCFTGFASLFPLVFASLYWRRVTKAGAYASVLATAVTWAWLFAQSGYGANRTYLFLGMMPVATIVIVSTVVLVVVSLITKPPSQTTVEKFFRPVAVGQAT